MNTETFLLIAMFVLLFLGIAMGYCAGRLKGRGEGYQPKVSAEEAEAIGRNPPSGGSSVMPPEREQG